MKKFLITLTLLAVCVTSIQAQSDKDAPPEQAPRPLDEWTFLQLGFFPNTPGYTKKSNVYGIKLGLPMCSGWGRVYGVEASGLYSGTNYVDGIQASWFGACIGREIFGVQATTFGPCISRVSYGVQASGPFCYASEHLSGIQASLVNISGEHYGIQAGVVNISKPFTGFQTGAVNIVEKIDGLQFGAFNYSKGKAVQMGFINIIEDGWLPFTLIFNIKL